MALIEVLIYVHRCNIEIKNFELAIKKVWVVKVGNKLIMGLKRNHFHINNSFLLHYSLNKQYPHNKTVFNYNDFYRSHMSFRKLMTAHKNA